MKIKQLELPYMPDPSEVEDLSNTEWKTTQQLLPNGHTRFTCVKRQPE